MAARYKPKFHFVLADKLTGKFPEVYEGLISNRALTSSLERTYVFDDRNDPDLKASYFNAVYKGVVEFEPFVF